MARNEITIEFLDDGRVKVKTGAFDAATHRNADSLVNGILAGLGGEVERERNKDEHEHTHEQEHVHHKH